MSGNSPGIARSIVESMRSPIPVLLVASLAVLVGACGSSGSSAQSSPTGGVQATSATQTNFHVTTPNGEVQLSLDGQLPPSWPGDFPTPPGSKAAGSGTLAGNQNGVMVGVYTTDTPAPQAFVFYTSGAGMSTTDSKGVGSGSAYVGKMKITAPYTGSITVFTRNAQNYIVAVLTK